MPLESIVHWLLIISGITFLGVAVYFHHRNNNKLAMLCLCIAALVLRIFTAKDGFLHQWDERYHALVAKNLMSDFLTPMLYKNPILPYDYKEWAANHIWLHKQPIPLWSMAISMKLFGISAFSIRIPSLILSTILVPATHGIASILYNKKVAFIAAFLCAINGLIIEQSGGRVATDHIDIYFLCFIGFSVYTTLLYHKSNKTIFLVLTAFFTSLAILSKWLPALIIFPIWCLSANLYRYSKQKLIFQLLSLSLIILALVLPWQVYIFQQWPKEAAWESHYNSLHIFTALGSETGGIFYQLIRLTIIFSPLIIVPLAWLFWKTIKTKNIKLAILSVWIFIPLLFFSVVKTKMQAYLLFTAPAIFILSGLFIVYARQIQSKFKPKLLLKLVTLLLLVLPVHYCFNRIKPFENNSQEGVLFKDEYAQNDQKTIIFNEAMYIEAMFYSDCAAVYPYIPSKEKQEELKALGYRLIIK